MADEEQPKKKYIVIQNNTLDWLQAAVEKKIKDKYHPIWTLLYIDKLYIQPMLSDEVVSTYKVSSVWSIGWTVNVSWCWGWWD